MIESRKATPGPDKLTLCGLPGALLEMSTDPPRVPTAVGVKVTLILQLAPTERVAPQVVVRARSPLVVMEVMLNGALPGLVKVTLRVRFADRYCDLSALVLGDEALLGAVPMEMMDLVVTPSTQTLSINPESPLVPTASAK